jgi:colanic acid/amylovoran biosynthesis protein
MRSDAIFSRDKDSIKIIENLLGPNIFKNKTIHFCPDVAFSLQSEKVDEPSIIPSLPSDFPVVGINVNGLMYNGGYSQDNMFGLKLDYKMFIFGIIQEFLKIENLQILLVPHTFGPSGNINSDPDACKDALLKFSNHNFSSRIHMVNRQYNQSEIKYIIGLCQFFIGSRMHSCIAGLSQGIPTIGVAYSKKFRGVFNSIGVDELVIDARNETTDNAIKKTIAIFHDSDRFISHLHQNVSSAIDNTYKSIDSIISRQPYSLQHTAY